MQPSKALESHLRSLEDEFFFEVDQKLRRELREQMQREQLRSLLAQATSLDDESVLDELLDLGITADTWTAILLVPLVLVAWADEEVTDAERDAVHKFAEQYCPQNQALVMKLIARWLDRRPSAALWTAWEAYIAAVQGQEKAKAAMPLLGKALLNHAQAVAEASAGFLGMNRINAQERETLKRVADSLESS